MNGERESVSGKIVINGREYGSVEDMPEGDFQLYLKAMQAMKFKAGGASPGNTQTVVRTTTTNKYLLDGKEYHSIEELPEEVREAVRSAEAISQYSMPEPTQITEVRELGRTEIVNIQGGIGRRRKPEERVPVWLFFLAAVGGAVLVLWLLRMGHVF